MFLLYDFILESNRIEGMYSVVDRETEAHEHLLSLSNLTVPDVESFVWAIEPGAKLRRQYGMDVRVGKHVPARGCPEVETTLETWLARLNRKEISPYDFHIAYETLHPFMDGNGRSGRALWLWGMGGIKKAPLGFLHHFYYQTLENIQ